MLISIFFFLQEYKYISSKRMAYFYSSKPQPHQFTILVRSIPVLAGSSVSESVESFFKEYHPTTYLSHMVIHRTSNLQSLIVSNLSYVCENVLYCIWIVVVKYTILCIPSNSCFISLF